MSNNEATYALLHRLQGDCDYYLTAGKRDAYCLWAKDERDHIAKMRELYESLAVKPTWITVEDIDTYERSMTQFGR